MATAFGARAPAPPTGVEPAAFCSTGRCARRYTSRADLSHHPARLAWVRGIEPPTSWFVARHALHCATPREWRPAPAPLGRRVSGVLSGGMSRRRPDAGPGQARHAPTARRTGRAPARPALHRRTPSTLEVARGAGLEPALTGSRPAALPVRPSSKGIVISDRPCLPRPLPGVPHRRLAGGPSHTCRDPNKNARSAL